ncbi:MAG TPA: ABC transporter ATP-binding protein [Pirellulales bacterium]|jgi:putative ABC transport system ATP-binding protein|nr:ABC transporter ATP-binding protein [Pirellulales bacterium]
MNSFASLAPTLVPPQQVLLHLDNIGKTYRMGEVSVEVLKHIDLQIFSGELLVLVGPSGSGKTTLLNLIGGLDTPTVGQVWYQERDISGATPRELTRYRRETIGFVFQFYNLVPNLTARENVLISTEISTRPMDVDEVLELVGLTDRADHFPAQMSGGEQQRVAIARALAKNPGLLLCDEPTGALDFETGKNVLRLLVDLKNRLGKTIMIITHNGALADTANRVVRLRSGQIVEIHDNPMPKPPEEIVW